MKSVMLSVRPEWCEKIASGEKTIEVRKTRPKLEVPFKVYIYCTLQGSTEAFAAWGKDVAKWNRENWGERKGKVIGEFVCDCIPTMQNVITGEWFLDTITAACLAPIELDAYSGGKNLYGWHISALQIYDKPKELSEFYRDCTEKDNCHKCIHWDSSYDNTYYEPPDPPFEGCRTGEKKHFIRPPQSWCYVEGET